MLRSWLQLFKIMTFNAKHHSTKTDYHLIKNELDRFDIIDNGNGFEIQIGDESATASSLEECADLLTEAIQELKSYSLSKWKELKTISKSICDSKDKNFGNVENVLFLAHVKKSYFLASRFSELSEIKDAILPIFNIDVKEVNQKFVFDFNDTSILVKSLHRLIMREIYRLKLVNRLLCIIDPAGQTPHKREAQVSGPWANLDLPIEERMWEFEGEDEEYFETRKKIRRQQTRYNPEYVNGFYYKWDDITRDPYSYYDQDSPYKTRSYMGIG